MKGGQPSGSNLQPGALFSSFFFCLPFIFSSVFLSFFLCLPFVFSPSLLLFPLCEASMTFRFLYTLFSQDCKTSKFMLKFKPFLLLTTVRFYVRVLSLSLSFEVFKLKRHSHHMYAPLNPSSHQSYLTRKE